jgi:hypothetical protein
MRVVRWLILLLVFVGVIKVLQFLLGGDELSADWIGAGVVAISSHFLPSWSSASRSGTSSGKAFPWPWNGISDIGIPVVMIILGIVWYVSHNVFAFTIIVGACGLVLGLFLAWWISRGDEVSSKERWERQRLDLWQRYAQRRSMGPLRHRDQ